MLRAPRLSRLGVLLALTPVFVLIAAACDSSDNSERLAAQRLFRNVLISQDATAEADVRIEGLVDELPPDFPLPADLEMDLLGSAFTDTGDSGRLIVGWESDSDADALFEFFNDALRDDPWSIVADPRVRGIDFIRFVDADNPGFAGELRINQENRTVIILIADVDLGANDSSDS